MTFSTLHIVATSIVVAAIGMPLSYQLIRPHSWFTIGPLAICAGLTTLVWRLAANTPALNEDGFPGFSPNDLLAPVLTYIVLGIYSTASPPADPPRFAKMRALLTAVALAVNVVTI